MTGSPDESINRALFALAGVRTVILFSSSEREGGRERRREGGKSFPAISSAAVFVVVLVTANLSAFHPGRSGATHWPPCATCYF